MVLAEPGGSDPLRETGDTIVEGRWYQLVLSDEEAHALADLGRRLSSRLDRWGSEFDVSIDARRTVIEVERGIDLDTWRIRVAGSVGLVRLGERTITVQPKIPMSQFVDLLRAANGIARSVGDEVDGSHGEALDDLIEEWLVDAATHLVSHGLLRDYVERDEALALARGSVDQLATARSFLTGKLAVHCRYEEHELDTPVNRMLKAGLMIAARSVDERRARRAARLLGELRVVGRAEPVDWRHVVDRRTRVYEPAITLSRMLVEGTAISIAVGDMAARCFLVRSSDIFENGIRELIQQHLGTSALVSKRSFLSTTGGIRFAPDIVIDWPEHRVVMDVKYRAFGVDWDFGARNQIVAFAAVTGARHAVVIGIEQLGGRFPRPFSIDALDVRTVRWRATAADASKELLADLDELAADLEVADVRRSSLAASDSR